MRDGAIVQDGTPEELYFAPADRWAAEFLGAGNVLAGDGSRTGGRRHAARRRSPRTAPSGRGRGARPPRARSSSAPDPDGAGEVVGREFRGHDVFYRVRVDGSELVSQRPSNEVVPLGARVAIRLHDGRVAVLP